MATTRTSYDLMILAGDIGGTNTNLALVGKKGGSFTILAEGHYATRAETSLAAPLCRFLAEAKEAGHGQPNTCCISGAGPVVDGRISLTNAPWDIDRAAIEREFAIPTRLINDFTAISYGVLLLDPADPEEVTRIPHTDGSRPEPAPSGLKLIVGAGTGLGVGFVARLGDRVAAFPSEGGHVSLPAFDGETREFRLWLECKYGMEPGAEAGAEPGVSGQGIANLLAFLAGRPGVEPGPEARRILGEPEASRPALVAGAAERDPLCMHAMELFVELYARVCSDLSAVFLPTGGLYLAGGIASKNELRFLEGGRFARSFERSYAAHIRDLLARVPLMIVKDYSISLYGAANAAAILG